ncbi:MAG: DUF4142 domain-containing protein [Pseudomonadales bacterium]|nr:DUF4142 domain-containing protein [Pseudomonadales bacterium]
MKLNTQMLTIVAGLTVMSCQSVAQDPAELNDLEIAHVAYVADNIDIQYAHLAMALGEHPAVRGFAQKMISDHNNVNAQALALLEKLNAQPQNNFLSESLQSSSQEIVNELSQLRGGEFDLRYAENELAYHQAVNDLVANAFIPNIENPEVKELFEAGLKIFRAHEELAANMVNQVKASR